MLRSLDLKIFEWVNQFAGDSYWRDIIINTIRENELFKGVLVFLVWWGLWFAGDQCEKKRAGLMSVLSISLVAIFVGRLLAFVLPFRLRPIHDPDIAINLPIGVAERTLTGWSSLPSDHAVMFFSLAVGFFFVHRIAGVLLLFHATVIVSIPRVYNGWHFPSDIVAGAIIGSAISCLLFKRLATIFEAFHLADIEKNYGFILYPVLFFISFQAVTMFDSLRELANLGMDGGKALIRFFIG